MPCLKFGIALGSNLGDRAGQMTAARSFLFSLHAGPEAPLCSALYETEPVGCAPGTASFLNAVVEIESPLTPNRMFACLRGFEARQGRAADREANSPRRIDLDLLYAGGTRLASAELVLPHPRMTARLFVLQPLSEIRSDLVLPGQTLAVGRLLGEVPASRAVRRATVQW